MKLIVPSAGEDDADDLRLMRLAEFAGVECRTAEICQTSGAARAFAPSGEGNCLAVNARIFHKLLSGKVGLGSMREVLAQFPRALLYGLWPGEFCDALVRELTGDRVQSVREAEAGAQYSAAADAATPCGAFAGQNFGLAGPSGGCFFGVRPAAEGVQSLVSLGGKSLLLSSRQPGSEVVCIGNREIPDLEEVVGDRPAPKWLGRFLPAMMALRQIFGDACWRAAEPARAALIIDDPLLRPRYGYLDFEQLAQWHASHNFATTIAFIPYNFRRNAGRTVRLFRDDPGRLGICFHGNDHTGNEMASTDGGWLNTALGDAEARMAEHQAATGIPCPRVVVFPQEHFSIEAMEVLRARNYWAAIKDGTSPVGQRRELTIRELAQPAFMGFGGFPLFQRRYVMEATLVEVAFNLFFGRPVILCEHHAIFRNPEKLFEVVGQINTTAHGIRWGTAGEAVLHATLSRTDQQGERHVRAYARTAHILNSTGEAARYCVEWPLGDGELVEGAVCAGSAEYTVEIRDASVFLRTQLAAGEACLCSVRYRNEFGSAPPPGLRWRAKVAVRRHLSEARDNYASRSRLATATARVLRDRLVARGL